MRQGPCTKMNILTIYEASERKGGIQVHVSTLTTSLRELGDQVLVFEVPPLFYTRQKEVSRLLSLLQSIPKFINQTIRLIRLTQLYTNFQIIHVHGPRVPLILGYILAKKQSKPLIITMHEPKSLSTKLNPLWKKADIIITISKEIKKLLINLGGQENKIIYIPNMVKIKTIQKIDETNDKNILFIGRLHPDKVGILNVLLDAAPRIIETIPETKIQIMGPDGSSRNTIETKAMRINERYGEAVKLIGYKPDPEYHIANSKLVIGEARVGIESMIAGKPTIVGYSKDGKTFTGDLVNEKNMQELESYNFTGVNYSKEIDSISLSNTIIDILQEAEYTVKSANYCRKYINKHFGYLSVTKKIQKIYRETQQSMR